MQPYNTNNFVKLDYGNDRQDWKIAVFRILENQRQILTTEWFCRMMGCI